MYKKFAALAIAALILTGCSSINSGTITGKGHSDATQIPVSYCLGYNSKGICTGYGLRYDYYPERWWFDLKQDDEKGYVNVYEDTWNSYEVGDYFDAEEG